MNDKEKSNAMRYGKMYYARHMVAGLCGYDDETVLITTDTMKRIAASFEGKPVYVYHDKRTEAERVATLQETSHGYITETFYNELDGWLWSKFIVVDDEAFAAIGEGWKVSNAYIPTEYADGGQHNNLPYDREIINAELTHLAIVPDPRYEASCIMTPDEFKMYQDKHREQLNEMRNSKTEKKGLIMKFFKTKKEEVSTIDAETLVELTNSKGETVQISVSEMVNAVERQQAADAEKQKTAAKVKVGGKDVTVDELINSYQKLNAVSEKDEDEDKDEKENESDEDEKTVEDEEKENESDDEAKNSKTDHFKELSNAGTKSSGGKAYRIENNNSKIARGKSRYGSAK